MVEIPLPEGAVAEELKSRRDSIEQQLAYAGMTEADYLESEGQTADEFAADLDKRVRDAMAAQFLLDEIATAESLSVNEGELTQHMLRRAQQSGQEPAGVHPARDGAQPRARAGRRGTPRQGARARGRERDGQGRRR